jgi:hypothetical protein
MRVNLNKNTHPHWGESLAHTVPPRFGSHVITSQDQRPPCNNNSIHLIGAGNGCSRIPYLPSGVQVSARGWFLLDGYGFALSHGNPSCLPEIQLLVPVIALWGNYTSNLS